MSSFHTHRVRFYDFHPKPIHCLAYEQQQKRLAVSRSDGQIEIYSTEDRWFQEKVISVAEESSVESLLWSQSRLFSAGLEGDLVEYDLALLTAKASVSSNNGAIWCLDKNESIKQIAAGTENGCIVMFQLTTNGAEYHRSLDRQQGRILSISWYYGNADSEPLIISSGIDVIRVWSIQSGHALRRMTVARRVEKEETIIWAVIVTSDMIIVSGDSRGITSFWNGRQGTLIKEYHSHEADVLTLAVTPHKSVLAAGVDPNIVQFDLVRIGHSNDEGWVVGETRSVHSHDVRSAIVINDNQLITAGVDCHLVISNLSDEGDHPVIRIDPIPQRTLVHTAKSVNCVLLQYTNFVELWRLGSTEQSNGKKDELLQLSSQPKKLLELKCRSGESIICSAISTDAHWLAYSDQSTVRMFRLIMTDVTSSRVDVSVEKCRNFTSVLPARCLAFTTSGLLVSLTSAGSLQIIDSAVLTDTIAPATDMSSGAYLLAVSPSGQLAMVADHCRNVNIYDIEKKQHQSTIPTYRYQATAMTFHPTSQIVAIAYADNLVIEYNLLDMAYTEWSRTFGLHHNRQWRQRHHAIRHIAYHPHSDNYMFLADSLMFCFVNKQQPFPRKDQILFKKTFVSDIEQDVAHAFHVYTRAKYVLHFDVLDDGSLLLVEKPPADFNSLLPPVLKVKKFGT